MRLVAGIVAFNPNLVELTRSIEAIRCQVDELLVVDNASLPPVSAGLPVETSSVISVLRNDANRGMSGALNQVMTWACTVEATAVLLLDQDSIANVGLVETLRAELEPSVGMVAARYVDRNIGAPTEHDDSGHDVDNCITSGSLCRVAAWDSIRGYDEQLFIDFVDFDFCLRLRLAGWRIRLAPRATISHEIGEAKRHGRTIAYGHSAFRSYYLARDMVLYARKHRRAPKSLKVHRRGVFLTCLVIVRRMIIIARYEPHKLAKIRALVTGMASAFIVQLGDGSK